MKYCLSELLHRTKKSTLNFYGLSLLHRLTGLKEDCNAAPPSLKLNLISGIKVQYDDTLSAFNACQS